MNDLNRQPARHNPFVYALLPLAFYLLAYFLPLGARDLFVPDEPRYAEIPREMITSGDWTVPHFNGLRYFEKPPFGYWVHALSLIQFGERENIPWLQGKKLTSAERMRNPDDEFAVRLPQALAVALSAALIFLLAPKNAWQTANGHRHFAPVAATLIFLSSIEVFAVGNTAVLDSLLAFLLTACTAAFYIATKTTRGSGNEKIWLAIAGLFCGLAFLTKGFLAFAVPVLTLAPYLLWQRRYTDIFRMAWLPILVAVLVALPWAVRIHLREPDFWNFFFWNEHIRRFASDNAQHKEAFWPFLLSVPALVFPWTFLLPAAALGIKKLWREQGELPPLLKLCLCWLFIPLLFFSLSSGKLLTYILPCFPPFAILMTAGLLRVLRPDGHGQSKLFQAGVVINGLLSALVLIAFVALQFFSFHGFRPYSETWQVMVIACGLLFSLVCCWYSYRGKKAAAKIVATGIALLPLYFMAHHLLPEATTEVKTPGPFLTKNRASVMPDDIIIADGDSAGAGAWYLRRDNIYVLGYPGEMSYGLSYPDAKARRLDLASAAALIEKNPGKAILIARVRSYEAWRDKLPPPLSQEQDGKKGYVFIRF